MQEHRIRRTGTNSVNSVDEKNFVDVDIKQHTKVFPFPDVAGMVDQREQFEVERTDCTKYRLILSINPYCSNVLFNAVSEIVQNEGTDDPLELRIATDKGVFNGDGQQIDTGGTNKLSFDNYTIMGKDQKVTNTDMVRNTEYTNGGFVYHCGYDMFNNHILRNQTFKLVNPITNKSYAHRNTRGTDKRYVKDNFNTIRDFMRYSDGSEVTLKRRTDVNTIEGSRNKAQENARHLYMRDDVLSFVDSINMNLTEENGWWGFYNKSAIASCNFDSTTKKWEDMKISKVFNDEESLACGFVEMYPDSSLFSFNPKYNAFQNREEQNWDICLTYPYENDYKRPLVKGLLEGNDVVNSLLLADYEYTTGTSGQNILMFKSYVKHNLNIGDKIKLYYVVLPENDNTPLGELVYKEITDIEIRVTNTGDLKGDNKDYYFYVSDVNDILYELGDETLSEKYYFRFAKENCEYYYRKFKKLPNFKEKKEELTTEIANDKDDFEDYVDRNCKKNGKMLLFNREQYPLGFAKTIYNDDKTQVVFTDTIEIDKLVDNLGRPLSEIYLTIIKTNNGHDLWYKKRKNEEELKKIEYSHCFGELVSGLQVLDTDKNISKEKREEIGDVKCIDNTNKTYALDENITLDTDIFYGDVVEFNTTDYRETTLSDVCFRFNTEQREHQFNRDELNCGVFIYDDIRRDDYDLDNFFCKEYNADDENQTSEEENYKDKTTYRPEGYYYKAHYPIKLKGFGAIQHNSNELIPILSCQPKQSNGLFIEVNTPMKTNVKGGSTIYLCNSEDGSIISQLHSNTIQNSRSFLLEPMIPGSSGYITIFNIVEGLKHSDAKTITSEDIANDYSWVDENGRLQVAQGEIRYEGEIIHESDLGRVIYDYATPKYCLVLKNEKIPDFAYNLGDNNYVWRDVINLGDGNSDTQEYPFTNGHFYINKEVNFFLKRQDPFNYNNLQAQYKFPNDIVGNIKKESIYEYNDVTTAIC